MKKPCPPPSRWIFPATNNDSSPLLAEVLRRWKMPPSWGSLLLERSGASSFEELERFLQPRLAHLSAPEEITGMEAMGKRLWEAIVGQERLLLFGDYDVDGITSLAMLQRFLGECGLQVATFLPERSTEGYGLSQAAVERAVEEHHPQVVLALDCGTNSYDSARWLEAAGVELLLIDHHEPAPQNVASIATVMINPKFAASLEKKDQVVDQERKEEKSTDQTIFCTAGLVFKLMHMMLKLGRQEGHPCPNAASLDLKRYLDLVALGTVADIAPMEGENRLIVRHGLRQLERSCWSGLKALIEVSEVTAPFSAATLGFQLAPRINAAGRLGSAVAALKLLTTDSLSEATRLAHQLHLENKERQRMERQLVEELHQELEERHGLEARSSIVLGKAGWHQGILGIVASRIAKKWHRPTLVISFDEEGKGKGSGRSVPGCSLVQVLSQCAEHLEEFGGHTMAAGITLQEENLPALEESFEREVEVIWECEERSPKRTIAALVELSQMTPEWLAWQDQLGPFGAEHPQPIFVARNVFPAKEPRILKEKHYLLELQGENQGGAAWRALFFHGATESLPEPPWEVAFTLERNTFRGVTQLQLHLIEVRSWKEVVF